jgi:hypothetical protein
LRATVANHLTVLGTAPRSTEWEAIVRDLIWQKGKEGP